MSDSVRVSDADLAFIIDNPDRLHIGFKGTFKDALLDLRDARARITALEDALNERDTTLREIHSRPDALASAIRDRARLEAELAEARRQAEQLKLEAMFGGIDDDDDLSVHDKRVHVALLRQRDVSVNDRLAFAR